MTHVEIKLQAARTAKVATLAGYNDNNGRKTIISIFHAHFFDIVGNNLQVDKHFSLWLPPSHISRDYASVRNTYYTIVCISKHTEWEIFCRCDVCAALWMMMLSVSHQLVSYSVSQSIRMSPQPPPSLRDVSACSWELRVPKWAVKRPRLIYETREEATALAQASHSLLDFLSSDTTMRLLV